MSIIETGSDGFNAQQARKSFNFGRAANQKQRNLLFFGGLGIILILLLLWAIFGMLNKPKPFTNMVMATNDYTVQRGENLAGAARRLGGDPIVAALMNATSLEGNFTMSCPAGDVSGWPYRVHTAYCNSGLVLPWASTLKPGMQLRLPATNNGIPARALSLVAGMKGHIALLINADAGQPTFDAAAAATMAIEHLGKGLTQNDIWVYSPRHHTLVNYLQRGTVLPLDPSSTATMSALGVLKFMAVDQVLLVTNERSFNGFDFGFRPVYGLCTSAPCVKPMANLAKTTKGASADYAN